MNAETASLETLAITLYESDARAYHEHMRGTAAKQSWIKTTPQTRMKYRDLAQGMLNEQSRQNT